jgi:predicted DNA-binding transcriptional regulator AlpA
METEPPAPPRMLSKQDLARIFGIAEVTVDLWRKKGLIPPPTKVGRACRWPHDLLRTLVRKNTPAAA